MEPVLVTGGAGFIGSHLVKALLGEGWRVRVLDNFFSGSESNLKGVLQDVELIDHPAGILSPEVCEQSLRGVRYAFHLAAVNSVPRSVSDPMPTDRVNAGGTLVLLEAARAEGVERFIYASSSSVYGDSGKELRSEEDPTDPGSPYAASKMAGEMYCNTYHKLHGLGTVCLRYFNVFGPFQTAGSLFSAVVPELIRGLMDKEQVYIYGDGEQSRDFTFVDNVVQGNLLAIKATGVEGETFNIATGVRCSVNRLFMELRALIGADGAEPVYADPRPGDVMHSYADISKAKEILGYEPSVGLREGLERTVAWHTGFVSGIAKAAQAKGGR